MISYKGANSGFEDLSSNIQVDDPFLAHRKTSSYPYYTHPSPCVRVSDVVGVVIAVCVLHELVQFKCAGFKV